jgi:muramoyltetrapeptide carboxypeptidase
MLLPPRLGPGERTVRVGAGGLNAALRDPGVRAVVLSGSHRDLDDLDVAAAERDPKPIVGTGGTTFVHLELWARLGLAGIHGTGADLTQTDPVVVTGEAAVPGRAEGVLLGGDLGALRAMVGAGLPDLDGAILLLSGERTQGLGQVDRQLTHLRRAGIFDRVCAVAVGAFTGFDGYVDRGWSLGDVLGDHLARLTVPVLTGLGGALPIGTNAVLADGTLTIGAAVR